MPTCEEVIINHEQLHRDSCAASGMELVLKLHSLVDSSFYDFQDKYGDDGIGWGKLADLRQYDVFAQSQNLPRDEALEEVLQEVNSGHFPLLAIPDPDPQNSNKIHIWIAVPHRDPRKNSFRLASRAHNNSRPLWEEDLSRVEFDPHRKRCGKVEFVTYSLIEPL